MKLGEIATVRTGLVLSRKKASALHTALHYRMLTLKSFSDTMDISPAYMDDFYAGERIDTKYIIREGDVVVRLRAPVRALYIDARSAGAVVSSLMAVVRVKDKRLTARFLAQVLNAPSTQKILEREIKGTTIPMIKTKDLASLEVILPPLDVQEETAALLALSRKEELLLHALIEEKQHLSQQWIDTIIQQHKED